MYINLIGIYTININFLVDFELYTIMGIKNVKHGLNEFNTIT